MKIRNDRIKKMLFEDSISIADFAKGIGKTEITAAAIVKGTIKQPKIDTFTDICNFFGCGADYLLGRSDNRYYF